MNDLNSAVQIGEFLTGNIDFFTIYTLIPCDNTHLTKTLETIKKEMKIPLGDDISTVGGVTQYDTFYSNDDLYENAYAEQTNLNNIIRIVEQRTQPVMLNVTNLGVVSDVSEYVQNLDGSSPDFGTDYSGGSHNLSIVKFAVEHRDAWENKKVMAEFLDKTEILDKTPPFITGSKIIDTSSTSGTNTIVIKNEFL